MKTLAPSILAADLLNLGAEIKKIEDSGSKYVHFDVMDGVFVPNISFGMPVLSAVRSCTDLTLDVHLMIVKPNKYFKELISLGADMLTFHLEALEHNEIIEACEFIHKEGKRVGISIKPNTPAEAVFPYLDMVDMVLVMTVEPGFGGQKFMTQMMEKVKAIRAKNATVDIQVDGGINNETIKVANEAGANIFVLGTGFFKAPSTPTIEALLNEK
ncbi:MAG: ribulose-phosphate 3-epimerase [Clostridia bacterium]|nr:ribulose-phosphate 3-epimerase [Clostridia bacterium]